MANAASTFLSNILKQAARVGGRLNLYKIMQEQPKNTWQSEEVDKVFESLFSFHSNYTPPSKTGKVTAAKRPDRAYLTLDGLIAHVRPQLKDVGLFLIQQLAGGAIVTTIAHKESGQYIKSSCDIVLLNASQLGNAAQQLGASITYQRRYSLCAVLGISTDEDNDGANINAQQTQQKPQQQTRSTPQGSGNQNQQPSEKAKYALKMNIKELEALDAATANVLKEEMMALHKSGVWGKTLCSQYIDKLQAAKEAAGNKQAAKTASEAVALLDDVPF